MGALTLQYRPAKWSDVVEQNAAVETLSRMVQSGQIHPVVVLHGPAGTGKTSLARILAAALNCEAKNQDLIGSSASADQAVETRPCGLCPSCVALQTGRSMAIVELDAASNGLIDDVRRIQEEVQIVSSERYRVYVLDEAHGLSSKAWDALLKLLEEPPVGIVFVFCTTEIDKVPDTILSRAFSFGLRRVGHAAVKDRLLKIVNEQRIQIDQEVVDAIAFHTDGGLRDAISLLEQLSVLSDSVIKMETFDRVIGQVGFIKLIAVMTTLLLGDVQTLYRQIDVISQEVSDSTVLIGQLVEVAQWICRVKTGACYSGSSTWSGAKIEQIERLAEPVDLVQAVELQRRLLGLYEGCRRSRLPARIAVETGLIALMGLKRTAVAIQLPVQSVSVEPSSQLVAVGSTPITIQNGYRSVRDIAASLGGTVIQQKL